MIKNFILLGFFTILTLFSCKKEDNSLDLSINGEWLLISGEMYIENLETGDKTVYNHFSRNKSISSLRYEGVNFVLERIVRDSTVWSFYPSDKSNIVGQFWLNYDSLNPYGLNVTNSNITIIENSVGPQKLGGSARPISIYSVNGDEFIFRVQETYSNIDGYNVKYYNLLKFIRN